MSINYFKHILIYFLGLRFQLTKYLAIGVSTVIFDMATLIFLKEIFQFSAVTSVVINQIFVISYNFTLNKIWVFKNYYLPHFQIIRYLLLAAFNYSVSIFSMYSFHQLLGYNYRLVRLLTIVIATTWTFFLYKYWVYNERS